jgi:hypothetical protein
VSRESNAAKLAAYLGDSRDFRHNSDVRVRADEDLEKIELAGLTVFDIEAVVDAVAELIHSRTQLVEMDADDLAWDVLNLLKGQQ